MPRLRTTFWLAYLCALAACTPARGEKTVFYDQVTGCEIWRFTNEPETFYTHNYVDIPSIDASGRWVAFQSLPGRVHVAELASGEVKDLGKGCKPVWHPSEPVVFYGSQKEDGTPVVMRAEAASGKSEVAVEGIGGVSFTSPEGCLSSTSPDGRYGAFIKDRAIWRVELRADAKPELVMRTPPGCASPAGSACPTPKTATPILTAAPTARRCSSTRATTWPRAE